MNDQELKHQFNRNRNIAASEAQYVMQEMINREFLNGYIVYMVEQTITKEMLEKRYSMDINDAIQIGLIELMRKVDKFQPGRMTLKSYAVMCLRSRFLKIIEHGNLQKRAANVNAITGENFDEFLLEAPINVEKHVVSKLDLLSSMKKLRDIEIKAVLLVNDGYMQQEVAERIGFKTRQGVGKLLGKAYTKMRDELQVVA